jgi:hypothetical protein
VMDLIGEGGKNFATSRENSRFGDALWLETVKTVRSPSRVAAPHRDHVGPVFCVS